MPTFAFFAGDVEEEADLVKLRELAATYLRAMRDSEIVTTFGIHEELGAMLADGGADLASRIPMEWLTGLAVLGDAATCARQIESRLEAGADSVVLFPVPFERADELIAFASDRVLPLVGSA
jgi:alkanesulfonate monooxygenase SsuD/methylene tetrahydromethanopterin reductase-like flavin-dependent oxidoreductase (luciferase family)